MKEKNKQIVVARREIDAEITINKINVVDVFTSKILKITP